MSKPYIDQFSLQDRVILVTGGAGHLGTEISKGLASFGATVVVVGRSRSKLDDLSAFNSLEVQGAIDCYQCDVSDEQAFQDLVVHVQTRYQRLDGLVNNASFGNRDKWQELDKKGWLDGLEGSLNHYFTCTKAVSESMLQEGKGVIINNLSLWSFLAPDMKMYLDLNNEPPVHVAAGKAAALQMTKYLASLWASKGIRVNAFTPGWFPKKGNGPERLDYLNEITSRTPMGRIGYPSDVVGTVVFLASDASSFMTGQNMIIDGGYSLW